MATQTPTIDSQVHAYERNRPGRPWNAFLEGPDEVTGDDMVAAMGAVGVSGALLISPFRLYGYDASYALEVYAKHPGRFGLIKPFDSQSEAVADEIAEWAGTEGVVGARVMLADQEFEPDDPGLNRLFAAGSKAGIPVNVMASGKLPLLRELARRNPETQVVIDHVGLAQPFVPPAPPEPFADLACSSRHARNTSSARRKRTSPCRHVGMRIASISGALELNPIPTAYARPQQKITRSWHGQKDARRWAMFPAWYGRSGASTSRNA